MKKWICLLLAAILVFSSMQAFAEDIIIDDEENTEFSLPEESLPDMELVPYDYDDITVGNPTPLNGQFFTDLWGNDTSDTDVRQMVTGYNLVTWDGEASIFRFDRSVVSGAIVSDDAEGNRSYIVTLYSDMYYSDGTPITAWDYAFSVLLQGSPLINELGGQRAVYDYLAGYEDYASGQKPYIAGLRVLAENMLMFTVKSEALPYFYELSRLAFYPYPIHAIAPGCAVYDDGKGAYIGGAASPQGESPFTAALLSETILNPETGFMSHPSPASGPYCLTSYDGSSAVFEINPYYKGNEEGKKPRIARITFTAASNGTMIQELSEGVYALLNKVAAEKTIADGLRLCMENRQYTRSNYPRIGLTYFYFNPVSEAVQELSVRQAIAHCFDKRAFVQDYVGPFGLECEALYGIGQWMYNAVSGTLSYPETLSENPTPDEEKAYQEGEKAWDELTLDGLQRYDLDVEKAILLLEEAGWTLNERGEAFDPLSDGVRCKTVDGKLVKLELSLGYQPRADVESAFEQYLTENLRQAGIGLTAVPLDFDRIVKAHNDHIFDSLDLLYFGDNFNISFDPALFFPDGGADKRDSLYAAYQELFALAKDMDHTEPRAVLEYMQKWIRFQERLTELLPILPVYNNIYFDFFTRELDGYLIETNVSWAKAIVPARMRSIQSIEEDTFDIEMELSIADGSAELNIDEFFKTPASASMDYTDGALSLFPEAIRKQVPAEYRTIYEFVAGKLPANIDENTEELTAKYTFQTPYEEDERVYLLFGVRSGGSDVEWFVAEGIGLNSGAVGVTLEKEQWQKLVGITFALAVVSQ